jgi:hypothetical protein
MTMQAEDDRLGQVAYDAYATQTGGVSLVSGEQLPPWADLDDSIQTAWIAAARTVLANASGLIATEVGPPPAEPDDEGDELEEPEVSPGA